MCSSNRYHDNIDDDIDDDDIDHDIDIDDDGWVSMWNKSLSYQRDISCAVQIGMIIYIYTKVCVYMYIYINM
jgi:hypothetical protein